MSNKVETRFDEAAFEKWESRMMQHAQQFYEAITALQAEGIDVSVKSISEYPVKFAGLAEGDPRKYNNHFRKLYEEAEKRAGWLPKNEKDRMVNSFMGVCNKTINHAEKICQALNFGLLLRDDNGTATPDTDLTAEEHKPDFTYRVDVSAMSEHWKMLTALREQMDEIKAWELRHGIQPIGDPNAYDRHGFSMFIHRKEFDGKEATMSEQEHNHRVWQYFKLPGNKE